MIENDLKNISLDETMFVIGSGPSLNKIDLSLLKDLNTFGMNRQYVAFDEWGFSPKYYAIVDWALTVRKYATDIIPILYESKCKIEKLFVIADQSTIDQTPANLENKVMFIPRFAARLPDDVLEKINREAAYKRHDTPDYVIPSPDQTHKQDLISGHSYANCGTWATSLSYLLGFKRVVLLGIDADFNDLHFHPEYDAYDGAFEGANPPDQEAVLTTWSETKKMICGPGFQGTCDFEIISCTPDSPINSVFEYIKLESLLELYE